MSRLRRLPIDPNAIPAGIFLIVLLAIGLSASPYFAAQENVGNVLIQVTPLLVVAVGQTFAVATGGLDLSVGAAVTLTSIVTVTYMPDLGPLAIPVAIAVGIVIGIANGSLIVSGIHPFLATMATMSVVQGVAFIYRPGGPAGSVPEWFGELAGYWGEVPHALPFALAIALGALVILRRTHLGLHVLAIGGDAEVARLAGIRVGRTRIATYAICAACASLSGVFVASRTQTGDPLIGNTMTLDSLAAVVLGGSLLAGGRVTIVGTVLGAICLGLLSNVMNFAGLDYYFQLPVKGALLALGVLLPSLAYRARVWQSRRGIAAAQMRESSRPAAAAFRPPGGTGNSRID